MVRKFFKKTKFIPFHLGLLPLPIHKHQLEKIQFQSMTWLSGFSTKMLETAITSIRIYTEGLLSLNTVQQNKVRRYSY